jgi:hypothetical protein
MPESGLAMQNKNNEEKTLNLFITRARRKAMAANELSSSVVSKAVIYKHDRVQAFKYSIQSLFCFSM